jgi:hypothetical protein
MGEYGNFPWARVRMGVGDRSSGPPPYVYRNIIILTLFSNKKYLRYEILFVYSLLNSMLHDINNAVCLFVTFYPDNPHS